MDQLQRIEDKLDGLQKSVNDINLMTHGRLTKLETTQKGVVTLCVAVLTAALTSLAKAFHIAS